jgi:hypothetical protein
MKILSMKDGNFIERHPLSQRFHDLLVEMGELHDKKQSDYGRANDPFANVRSTEEWGQPAWVGAMIRATDKLRRLQKVAQGGTLANEGVYDSLLDLAVYALIAYVLYEEGQRDPEGPQPGEMVKVASFDDSDFTRPLKQPAGFRPGYVRAA